MQSNPTIFLSAGEASGDQYGAELIAALRERLPEARFFGLGGTKMGAAGQERVVRAEDVAVMGITEVILHMPKIYGKYRQLVGSIKARRPNVAVLIDFPDVNFRLAKELKKLGVPVVWFVSPQLWAWKRGRLRWVQERVDRMMVIFPFEETFYRARGVEAEFVGHPLAETALPSSTREEYAERHGLDGAKPWVALLPGSRKKEVAANLGEMLRAVVELERTSPRGQDRGQDREEQRQKQNTGVLRFAQDDGNLGSDGSTEVILDGEAVSEYLLPVASTLDVGWVKEQIDLGTRFPKVVIVEDAREAMFHARASVVASGTATVLAAVIGNPFVVVYRVSDMTYRVAKRLVRYPEEIPAQVDAAGNLPVGMVNLIAGRRVVPELLQDRFTAANVAAALRPLLADGPERERMISDLKEVRVKQLPDAGLDSRRTAIERVAEVVEGLLVRPPG